MYPIIPTAQALFAAISTRDAGKNLIKMGTNLCHNFSSRKMDLAFAVFNCNQAATFSANLDFVDLLVDDACLKSRLIHTGL